MLATCFSMSVLQAEDLLHSFVTWALNMAFISRWKMEVLEAHIAVESWRSRFKFPQPLHAHVRSHMDMAQRRRLSPLSGQLQGGFLASSLPSYISSWSGGVSKDSDPDYIHQSWSWRETKGIDNASVMTLLKSIHDKLGTLEEKHIRLTDALRS